jgi:uncharacterized membrane protein
MTYIKYIQYVYLLAAGFFLYDAVNKLVSDSDESPWLSFFFFAMAVFMFFFRRKFADKYSRKP